jgi:hypothetical protein
MADLRGHSEERLVKLARQAVELGEHALEVGREAVARDCRPVAVDRLPGAERHGDLGALAERGTHALDALGRRDVVGVVVGHPRAAHRTRERDARVARMAGAAVVGHPHDRDAVAEGARALVQVLDGVVDGRGVLDEEQVPARIGLGEEPVERLAQMRVARAEVARVMRHDDGGDVGAGARHGGAV